MCSVCSVAIQTTLPSQEPETVAHQTINVTQWATLLHWVTHSFINMNTALCFIMCQSHIYCLDDVNTKWVVSVETGVVSFPLIVSEISDKTDQRILMFNRASAVERSARESLWYNSVHCMQDQRGKNQEIIQVLHSCSTIYLMWNEADMSSPLMQISSYQYQMTYDLYIAAFAGAGITLLALVSDYASAGANLAVLQQWGTTIVLWLMWLSDAPSVGSEASQASMTDDFCTIALCSFFSADTNIIIML